MAEVDMVMEFKFGRMGPNMKVTGKMGSNMARANSIMLMGTSMKVLY